MVTLGDIHRILIIGGARLVAGLSRALVERRWEVIVLSSPRHLAESVENDGTSLADVLGGLHVPFVSSEDVNQDPRVDPLITSGALGIGIGAAWTFEKPLVAKFHGKLFDFMGIRLPQLRGGAHYTWQILMGNRMGSCNLQVIEGGVETFHKGPVIKSKEYFFPASCRIPRDYFDAALTEEVAFLLEFFEEVRQKRSFPVVPLQEQFCSYYPFLFTKKHGYIDWMWATEDIERFICAFDDPYAGASTFLDGERIFLKTCHAEYGEGTFHPFQVGLVYRTAPGAVFVASRTGTLVIRSALNERQESVLNSITVGQRFFTPRAVLEEALQFQAVYGSIGLTISP